ncbi:hypothetical protein ACFVW1_14545 [Streptomyces olivochromogenes]|uniref:hypothetical protein n=1 Tax=Streptomyces olivochromogenes TaxID=1963 RepID=UPI0036D97F84
MAPDYRIDEFLSLYTRSSPFRSYTKETKRNYYVTDDCLFLNFLWLRGKVWWNRELAALMSLYSWATKPGNGFMPRNPVPLHQAVGRHGQIVEVPDGKAKDARSSNVHWLTPRTFRLWVDVGLRGYGADGLPAPGWVGRLEDRATELAQLRTDVDHLVRAVNQLTARNRQLLHALSQPDSPVRALPTQPHPNRTT